MRDLPGPAPSPRAGSSQPDARERLGIVEFFRLGEHDRVDHVLDGLRRIGVGKLRTAVSWADWHAEGGREWYDWLLPRLARSVELVPCFTYTPPSLGALPKTSSPPRSLRDYADFLDLMVTRSGRWFEWVELWNEPNNLNDWDWHLDHEWRRFSEMIGAAAYWMRQRGKKTLLGGMCPNDPNWLRLMCERGVMDHIDAVGIHAFPETWQAHWEGWEAEIAAARSALSGTGHTHEIWISEVGYSTWRHDEARQLDYLDEALQADASRVYWYSYHDLDPWRASQEGFHFDERHYHTGMVRSDGSEKLLHRVLARGGIGAVRALRRQIAAPRVRRTLASTLITGGAGFVGANLASRLATEGKHVLILDALARPGVEENVAWLRRMHPSCVAVEAADVRDRYAVETAVRQASEIYHLAAQVAVTTSLSDPRSDFEVNAGGTLNLLEAVRRRSPPPPLVFSSTNKVYGKLVERDELREGERGYEGALPEGADEAQPLDLYSPYGCSKGAADQYVLDYARIYGLPAAVFRMSCIYGPRQFGTEDQGWVAHFMRCALDGRPITIYGDGKQVRDILFVDDLVEAFVRCQREMARCRGRAFNIGGGTRNAISLLELLDRIEALSGLAPSVTFADWRPGDQLYYASDIRRFAQATGWRPRVPVDAGLRRLFDWLRGRYGAPARAASKQRVTA